MLNATNGNGVKELDQSQLDELRRLTVQDLPRVSQDGAGGLWWNANPRGPILPAWGTRDRERVLRLYDRHDYNTLWQGAKANLCKKLAATPWEIKGGRNTTNYFQRVLQDAQFGAGWTTFVKQFAADYLRFDGGAYAELIAPGDPRKAPTGAITGIAALDSYYSWPTGDPEFPVVYWSRFGKIHTLHYTRVLHMVDMNDSDQFNPGYGLCALSRAIAVVERQLFMGRYIVSNLDDKPSPGVVIANNINKDIRDRMAATYGREQSSDEPPPWGNVMWIYNLDPTKPATMENFTFSRPPEKFDYAVYVQIDVDDLALAMGVDPQDLRPLSSRSTGTAAQSHLLHEKANGKTYGDFLIEFERRLNLALPESIEFSFDTHDDAQQQQDAQTAQLWAGVATALAPLIGAQQAVQLLADQVEAIKNVMVDEGGEIVQLTDLDPQPSSISGQVSAQVAAETPPPVAAGDSTPNNASGAQKDFDSTRAQFVANLTDLLHGSVNDEVSRRRAGTVMRGQLSSAGRQARKDGLEAGGVTTGLSDADLNAHAVWLAQQSGYVSDFLSSVYKSGLTDAEIDAHAELWANKSLQTAYYEGLESADANGLYEFTGTDGKESCATCQSLKGTKMRMSEWTAQKLRPGVDTDSYICGGWNCAHRLERVGGAAKGLETDEQRRWWFAHLGEVNVRTGGGGEPENKPPVPPAPVEPATPPSPVNPFARDATHADRITGLERYADKLERRSRGDTTGAMTETDREHMSENIFTLRDRMEAAGHISNVDGRQLRDIGENVSGNLGKIEDERRFLGIQAAALRVWIARHR